MQEFAILLMLLVANGSPIAARMVLGGHLGTPLDGGLHLRDGKPLLGPSKTLRGIVTAVVTTAALAAVLGYGWLTGALFGALAMLGDLISSFVKRRRGLASGAKAPGLDHIPESLLPLLVCQSLLGLTLTQVVLLSLGFMAADLLLSRLLFSIGVGEHPH